MNAKEIQQSFIVRDETGNFQVLYVTDHGYYMTSNGGFGQKDMYIQKIDKNEADKYLKDKK